MCDIILYMKNHAFPLFPCIVYKDEETTGFRSIRRELLDYVYNQEKTCPSGNKSNRGGYQTKNINFWEEDPTFKPYLKWLLLRLEEYGNFMGYKKGSALTIRSMWFNINGKGSYNAEHIHPQADLAGTLWIKTDSNLGDLKFVNPQLYQTFNQLSLQSDEISSENGNSYATYALTPKEGSLVIFPAFLPHCVGINNYTKDRISLSFNLTLTGGN